MAVFYDNPALRDCWFALATEPEVRGRPVARTLLGERLVIYTDPAGQVVAALDRCPHREAPLSRGTMENGVLVCPYHGWSFGEQGHCVRIPSADPAMPVPRNGHLHCFHTEVRYGLVCGVPGRPAVRPAGNQPGCRRHVSSHQ
ncbi:MAG: Rieske 2Fe-2S domain-containing protein [Woeseiaceae bacterium]|nr:Rieske 2Fe-2S domain-containing protein [Woeseiaceae bacterium]